MHLHPRSLPHTFVWNETQGMGQIPDASRTVSQVAPFNLLVISTPPSLPLQMETRRRLTACSTIMQPVMLP